MQKAKGKISSNHTSHDNRLLVYAVQRSGRAYVDWLSTEIPALSMMDDLIYGSARMISDLLDIPCS